MWPNARISVMGGEQAAIVLADGAPRHDRAKKGRGAPQEEEAFRAPIRAQYEKEGHPYFASARLWDDGIIDPADYEAGAGFGDLRVAQPADRADEVRCVQDVAIEGGRQWRPARPNPISRRASGTAKAAARGDATRYETIAVDTRESVAIVVLSRPDVHNAFNATLIAELTRALQGARSRRHGALRSSCWAKARASAPAPISTGCARWRATAPSRTSPMPTRSPRC
jgi:hypothetical protein